MSQKIKVEQIVDLTAIDNVVEDTTPELGGDLQSNGNDIVFADNDKAIFGSATGGDLQISHDGSNSIIEETGTGSLYIKSNGAGVEFLADNNEMMGKFSKDGGARFYYNNSSKMYTTATGVTVQGTLAATAVTGDGSGLTNLPAAGIANVVEDTSPQLGADLQTNSNDIVFADNDQAIFGAGSDLTIKSDGANALIQGSGSTYFRGGTVIIGANGGSGGFETGIRVNEVSSETSQVELYYDNGLRLETVSAGVEVTGDLVASGNVTAYSDQRLKDNIQTIDNALNKVEAMRGVTFTKDGQQSSGVIAQEIEQIAPELVIDGDYKSVAYGNLVGYLIEAVKELSDKVKELEAR